MKRCCYYKSVKSLCLSVAQSIYVRFIAVVVAQNFLIIYQFVVFILLFSGVDVSQNNYTSGRYKQYHYAAAWIEPNLMCNFLNAVNFKL